MPTDQTAAVAAARSFEVKGVEYFVTPLNEKGWGEFRAWMQDQIIDLTKRNLDGLTPTVQKELLQEAINTARRATLESPEGRAIIASVDGMYRIVWLHLLPRHPDITQEKVGELLRDEELLAEAMAKVQQANADGLPEALKKHLGVALQARAKAAKPKRRTPTDVQARRRRTPSRRSKRT